LRSKISIVVASLEPGINLTLPRSMIDQRKSCVRLGGSVDRRIIDDLERIVDKAHVVTNRDQMQNYLIDETPAPVRPEPAIDLVLVRPANAQQVSAVLQLANKHGIPVFPRGGGTGLVAGAIPTQNGIVLSMERMNRVEIDKKNMMAVAEAGVTFGRLLEAANEFALFFPPHPGDENAQLGGLVATNAGGSRAVRYGVMRNHVRGLEVVLPTGEILSLGGRLHKNNVGYAFMHLMTGSEGTLAVITKVILQLYPRSEATATIILPYDNRHDAISSVPKILQDASTPLAIEFVERDLMEMTAKHLGENWPVNIGNCFLIVIVAEPSRDQALSESAKIAEICRQNGALEPFYAESKRDQDRILRIRSNIFSALKSETVDILDVAVPISELARVIDSITEIATRENILLPVFGHAGDGNLHVHIMKRRSGMPGYAEALRDEIYRIAIEAGGVITGEHGIGKIRTEKLQASLTDKEIQLMKSIKRVFDPKNLLNPGTKTPL